MARRFVVPTGGRRAVDLSADSAEYRITLAPRERLELAVVVTAGREPAPPPRTLAFHDAATRRRAAVERLDTEATRIRTSHDRFDHWLSRSRADLPWAGLRYAG